MPTLPPCGARPAPSCARHCGNRNRASWRSSRVNFAQSSHMENLSRDVNIAGPWLRLVLTTTAILNCVTGKSASAVNKRPRPVTKLWYLSFSTVSKCYTYKHSKGTIVLIIKHHLLLQIIFRNYFWDENLNNGRLSRRDLYVFHMNNFPETIWID